MSMDIWMRENPLTYVWIGTYAVAFLAFAIEIFLVRQKRKEAIKEIQMMRDAGEDE